MQLNQYFKIQEFVPPYIFHRYGNNAIHHIDDRIIEVGFKIRELFGRPVIINNYHIGGNLKNRGYRVPSYKHGATHSQHKSGRAIDFNIQGIENRDAWDLVRHNWRTLGITTLEDIRDTPTWIHVDIRNTNQETLLIVRP